VTIDTGGTYRRTGSGGAGSTSKEVDLRPAFTLSVTSVARIHEASTATSKRLTAHAVEVAVEAVRV